MSDLEQDLRAMLAERAGDIQAAPDRLTTRVEPVDEVLDLGSWRDAAFGTGRRRWPILLAAAAVAAILAAVLTSLYTGPAGRHDPATHHSSAPIPTLDRTTCRVTDPSGWDGQVRASTFVPQDVIRSDGLGVEAATSDGGVLVSYERPHRPHPGSQGTELGLLPHGSRTVRDLGWFGIPSTTLPASSSLNVDVDGRTAVVSLETQAGKGLDRVDGIWVVDIDSGARRQLASTPSDFPKHLLGYGFIQDGTVYWDVEPRNGAPTRVYAASASGGAARLVAAGSGLQVAESASGLGWHLEGPVDRPSSTAPAFIVRRTGRGDAYDAVTDGTAYAWEGAAGALEWYSRGAGHVVSFPGLLGTSGSQAVVNAVAGPLVYFQGRAGSNWVLDTRTGGLLRITSGGTIVGSHGTATGDPLLGSGAPVAGRVMRLAASATTTLDC